MAAVQLGIINMISTTLTILKSMITNLSIILYKFIRNLSKMILKVVKVLSIVRTKGREFKLKVKSSHHSQEQVFQKGMELNS